MDDSDKTPPTFELKILGGKMIIYERELRLLGRSGSVVWVKAVCSDKDEKLTWHLEVKLTGEKEHAHLVNSINEPRQFPKLNTVVSFVADICPNVDSIEVEIREVSKSKPKGK